MTHLIQTYDSPVGELTLCADDQGIRGLWLAGQKYFGASIPEEPEEGSNRHLDELASWLDEYFAGKQPSPKRLTLKPNGSEFRQCVWERLCAIPYGETVSYGELAAQVAQDLGRESMSSQATGGAVGHNPISIVIPCHRVVGADGSLTGYAGGIDKKKWLLEHEGAVMDGLYVPKTGTAL